MPRSDEPDVAHPTQSHVAGIELRQNNMAIYQVEAGRTHITQGRYAEPMGFVSWGSSTTFAALRAAIFAAALLHSPAPSHAARSVRRLKRELVGRRFYQTGQRPT